MILIKNDGLPPEAEMYDDCFAPLLCAMLAGLGLVGGLFWVLVR